MLFDANKFAQLKNSHDLAWFLGVDHHNFKRLIRHMMTNKECTVITRQNLKACYYSPPHSNRSMQVYDLTQEQIKFLVCRQSVYWCSTYFETLQPTVEIAEQKDFANQPAHCFRPEGTLAFWELGAKEREVAMTQPFTTFMEGCVEMYHAVNAVTNCLKFAYNPDGTLWTDQSGVAFDEMIET